MCNDANTFRKFLRLFFPPKSVTSYFPLWPQCNILSHTQTNTSFFSVICNHLCNTCV